VLKGSAVCMTVVATVASAAYVGGHVKDQSAPLRPPLHADTSQVSLAPGVGVTSARPVTETRVS
jgi:hypothetical protein